MKWSEQMRVLQSEDEHYNQLVYDVTENALYINDKLIATLDERKSLDQNTFWDLKKKYPYIDDKNFLLNCLFKLREGCANPMSPNSGRVTISYFHPTVVEYPEGEYAEMGYYIVVSLFMQNKNYQFILIKKRYVDPTEPL